MPDSLFLNFRQGQSVRTCLSPSGLSPMVCWRNLTAARCLSGSLAPRLATTGGRDSDRHLATSFLDLERSISLEEGGC